jgi:preprotein translocase subunit SecY
MNQDWIYRSNVTFVVIGLLMIIALTLFYVAIKDNPPKKRSSS